MQVHALDVVRLVTRFNLYPEAGMHASWLPADWPARHRAVARLSSCGQAEVARLLRGEGGAAAAPRYGFDSRMSRLALLDGVSLRRLAAYIGLCAHRPLLQKRIDGMQLRRQAWRIDADAVDFVIERAPHLSAFPMNNTALRLKPHGAGRLVLDRGARLLLAA